jgi:hypothetical protein
VDSTQREGGPSSARPTCPRALCGWSPPPLAANTLLKARVDRLLVGYAPTVALVASIVLLFNLVPLVPVRAGLGLDGFAGVVGGTWCSLNFWRCRHAHCLVTGVGWLVYSAFLVVEVALGHSVVAGDEQLGFMGILGAGLIFEVGWYLLRGNNALSG